MTTVSHLLVLLSKAQPLEEAEAKAVFRRLWRFASGSAWKGKITVKEKGGFTDVLPHTRQAIIILNPRRYSGWLSLCWAIATRTQGPFTVAAKACQLAEHAKAKGWLNGELKPLIRPVKVKAQKAKWEIRWDQTKKLVAKWERTEKLAATKLKKLRAKLKWYERHARNKRKAVDPVEHILYQRQREAQENRHGQEGCKPTH